MKHWRRALANYIAKTNGTFPCNHRVSPDGANVQFSIAKGRKDRKHWRLRCLECNRDNSALQMAAYWARLRKATRTQP